MKSYPTRHDGTQFRSRLEARWATFFDIQGWRWEYEPFDLDGYIPDFVIMATRPLLVEVKPLLWPHEPCRLAIREGADYDAGKEPCDDCWHCAAAKIDRSGWRKGDVWIVGISSVLTTDTSFYEAKCGWHGQAYAEEGSPAHAPFGWSEANWGWCDDCNRVTIVSEEMGWDCSWCGVYIGKAYSAHNDVEVPRLQRDWKEAGNRTQWRPSR